MAAEKAIVKEAFELKSLHICEKCSKPSAFFVTSSQKSYNAMCLIFPIQFLPFYYCLDAEPYCT